MYTPFEMFLLACQYEYILILRDITLQANRVRAIQNFIWIKKPVETLHSHDLIYIKNTYGEMTSLDHHFTCTHIIITPIMLINSLCELHIITLIEVPCYVMFLGWGKNLACVRWIEH